MSCPTTATLAAAASDELPLARRGELELHVVGCARCAARLTEQELMAVALADADLAEPALSTAARRRLGDRVLVAANQDTPTAAPRRRAPAPRAAQVGFGILAAAAVAGWLAVGSRRSRPLAPALAQAPIAAGAAAVDRIDRPRPEAMAPPVVAAVKASSAARYTRRSVGGRDQLTIEDGTVAIDARGGRLEVVVGGAVTTVADARVEVSARGGRVSRVAVFAGSVELAAPGGPVVIAAGDLWTAPPAPTAPAVGVARAPAPTAAEWFRRGWLALRAGRHAEAIAAFDRADAPSVAEDAAYWAAIACQRAGDHAAARARLTRFVTAFPASPRRAEALASLAAPAPP